MDISGFIESGWLGFTAVILGGAALVLGLALGYGRRAGAGMRPFGQTWRLVYFLIFWYVIRQLVSPNLLRTLPIALFVPGIDLALALAIVWATIRDLSSTFTPDWTWRSGARAVVSMLPMVAAAGLVHGDAIAMPAGGWMLWGTEAFVLLPFVLRLAYSAQLSAQYTNTRHPSPNTKGDRL